jgi:PPOX class probable F420-dependent enzyme
VRKDLTLDELSGLVELPLLAVLATYRRDGTVLLSPVWHEWRAGGFNVATSSLNVKARHLRRNPTASLVICEHTPPYRGVEARCEAKLVTEGVRECAERIASRYLGSEAGAAYAEVTADDLLVRLEPDKLRAWDFVDEYP